ncbi:MAG TPA: DUF2231 domain-containing protein [Hymenobacter sp.]|jgi:uncharacterized membrane protein|nr:DUF2231 domain-containing protein [Hymenobacter sp.]HZG64855.1 DUF2231 domain-containing protein [Rubrobacteraceae bacterium]
MMNEDFFAFENLVNHTHGAVNHFPIALLFVSVGMDLFALTRRPDLHWTAWLLLVLGSIGAVAATVTGLISHLPYEEDPVLLAAIEPHQYTAFAATAVFSALTLWRWRCLRRGSEIGGGAAYLALALLGLVLLGITGLLGGNLLSEWGIGVKGITR